MQNNLETGSIRKIYGKYLGACTGSALILSVYSLVDCVAVGQYHGPNGTAALALIMPIWTAMYSLGMLFGVGGAVLMSKARGEGDPKRGNMYFTAAAVWAVVVALLLWGLVVFAEVPLLRFFGADDTLLPLAQTYMKWIKFVIPLFTLGQLLAAFIRNDNAPQHAMLATIAGGAFNIVGDYVFVFVCDMGIEGAGLATAIGQVISFSVLCLHFLRKRNGLRMERPAHFWSDSRGVVTVGLSSFLIDMAMGVLAILLNNQIMRLAGADALAVYGVIINTSAFVQSLAYGAGQAAQPLISVNYGARNLSRIREAARCGWISAAAMGVFGLLMMQCLPLQVLRLFMQTTPQVEAIAGHIMRIYGISYLILPLNIYATYYYQAILRPATAVAVSLARGLVLSGILVYVLPAIFGADALWWVMPITEVLIFSVELLLNRRYARDLKRMFSQTDETTVLQGM